MEYGNLQKDLIVQPELWRLGLQVSDSMLNIALFPPVETDVPIVRTFTLNPSSADILKDLEETVYANPLLLNDFKRIDCIIDCDSFIAIPDAITTPDNRRKIFEASYPEFDGELIECSLGCSNALLTVGLDQALARFMRRTFYGIRFTHVLSTFSRYCAQLAAAQRQKATFVSVRTGKIDVVILDGDSLRLANTFRFNTPADAAYYILASRSQLKSDPATEPALLYGNGEAVGQIAEILRPYVAEVAAMSQPAGKFRTDSTTASAPTDLIVLPICE